MQEYVDLIGQKFNRLLVIKRTVNKYNHKALLCKCDCGNYTIVTIQNLKSNNTKSCGCLKKEVKSTLKHGMKGTRLYNIWQGMKQRCSNKNTIKYKNYGGRGIKVCDEWKNDFLSFYNWAIQNGYDETKNRKEQTLDRIDVNGNYEPNNCRWVTHSINCRNRNNNVYLTKNGISKTIVEWSEELGISQRVLSNRAKKYTDEKDIFSKDNLLRKKHKSNTGEFGISKDKQNGYQLTINKKYIGRFPTLIDAINKREEILNGIR